MLTKEDKNVLLYLIDASDDNYFYLDDSNTILNMPRNELILILDSLGERGYLRLKNNTDGGKQITLTHKALNFKEYEKTSTIPTHPTQVFNIQQVSNSAFGNAGTVAIDNSISSLREQIESSNSLDKEDLQKITNILEMIKADEIPPKKGLLSRFSDVLERNGWYKPHVAGIILTWLMSQ